MFRLTAQDAYTIAKRLNPNKSLWRCIDNGKEWGFMFNPQGAEGDLIGASYFMIAKNGRRIYELPMIPANLHKVRKSKQVPVNSIIDEGGKMYE